MSEIKTWNVRYAESLNKIECEMTTQDHDFAISNSMQTEIDKLRAALAERDAKIAALEKQEPVAWSVTAGKELRNCIEITHNKSEAIAQYKASIAASTGSEFESIHYKIHNLYAAAGAAPTLPDWMQEDADDVQGLMDRDMGDN